MKPRPPIIAYIDILAPKITDPILPAYIAPLSTYYPRPYPPWLILLLALLACAPTVNGQTSHGTAVFIIRTPSEIAAASDSKTTNDDGSSASPMCKIRQFGHMFVSVNGTVKSLVTSYDMFAILTKIDSRGGSFEDKLVAFEREAKSEITDHVRRMRAEAPDLFQEVAARKSFADANFFGLLNGRLILYNRKFLIRKPLSDDVNIDIERHQCPGIADCPSGFAVLDVGPAEYKERIRKEFPGFPNLTNLMDVARRFVEMQIDDNVRGVGPPIDVLRVTKTGACWYKHENDKEREGCETVVPPCSAAVHSSNLAPKPARPRRKRIG